MAMHATATRSGGPLRCEIRVGGHVLATDEPESLGGENTAPTPHQLLPAALAGCVATMIELYARRKGWELGDVRVSVDYEPEEPRFDIHVRVPARLTPEQRARLRRVIETCPVRRALTADVAIEHHLGQLQAVDADHVADADLDSPAAARLL